MGNFFELPGKIVYGRVTEKVGNLCEVHPVFADELFGKLGFHLREELNDAASVMFPEKLLQLGTAV